MKFSISKGNQGFRQQRVNEIEDLAMIITHYNYSMGTFRNGDRKNKSFISAEGIALDFDGGLTLNEAKLRFASYKHIIAPTRSHQKEKGGKIQDRFRVILFLDKPIRDEGVYRATVNELLRTNPEADQACKEPARMFYPSTGIASFSAKGKTISKVDAPVEASTTPAAIDAGARGMLRADTKRFFTNGAPHGEGNTSLFKAAKDCQEQGYTQEEVLSMLDNMMLLGGDWRNNRERDKATIDSAYKGEPNEPQRLKESAFVFRSMGELFSSKEKLEWQVEKLGIKGGISILAGRPKSGKSTLVRQLALATLRGGYFLGRKVTKGRVLYLALEEHPAMLQRQFRQIGITPKDDMMIHVGPIKATEGHSELTEYMLEYKPELLVIDTLSLFGNFTNINDYEHVNSVMQGIRTIARETGVHVMLIHHTNKGEMTGTNSIMGSQAILGAVDTALIFNVAGEARYLTTTGRGIKNFYNAELEFNEENETYTFKREVTSEF